MIKPERISKRFAAMCTAAVILSFFICTTGLASLEKNSTPQKYIEVPYVPTMNASVAMPLAGPAAIGPGGSTDKSVNKAFLLIDGITGESKDKKHQNWIELIDYSQRMESQTSPFGSGGGAGKLTHSPLTVTKRMDIASPKLYLALNNGLHINDARLELVKAVW